MSDCILVFFGGSIIDIVHHMLMLLCGEENIREVIAFPVSGSAQDLLCNAPGDVTEQQLREVHIKVRD